MLKTKKEKNFCKAILPALTKAVRKKNYVGQKQQDYVVFV